MAQLITLSKLAALLSENTGISLNLCESFIRNLAQVTSGGLAEGEHIRIKDLGLFESRLSPDGTPSVEFIPESAFAERVNASYAHLRPFEAPASAQRQNEPVQPAMPQAPAYRQPEPQQYPATPQPQGPAYRQPEPQAPAYRQPEPKYPATPEPKYPATPEPQYPAYRQPEPQYPATPEPQYPATPEPQAPAYRQPEPQQYPAAAAGTPAYQQPAGPTYPEPQSDFASNPAFAPQQPESAPDLPAYLNMQDTPQAIGAYGNDSDTGSYSADTDHPTGYGRRLPALSVNKKYVLIGVLGLVIGFILGYLTARYCSDSDTADDGQTTDTEVSAATDDTPREYDHSPALSVADADTLTGGYDETADNAPAQPQRTVTLQNGQGLSDIAKQYYGHKDYWVYIYIENKEAIANPNAVRAGTRLRLPDKETFAPSANDEAANLAAARKAAAGI